jgi:hypothetical protein
LRLFLKRSGDRSSACQNSSPHDHAPDRTTMIMALDFTPLRHVTFRLGYNHRAASAPYFSGREGVIPLPKTKAPASAKYQAMFQSARIVHGSTVSAPLLTLRRAPSDTAVSRRGALRSGTHSTRTKPLSPRFERGCGPTERTAARRVSR